MSATNKLRGPDGGDSVALLHFGKLPCRGDFVRSAQQALLLDRLDQWLCGTLELLAADPNWKLRYDQASPVNFAVLGSKQQRLVAGHLRPSADSAGRRFPFVVCAHFETPEAGLLDLAPMVAHRLWHRCAQTAARAQQLGDAALQELNQLKQRVTTAPREDYQAVLDDYAEVFDLWHLQAHILAAHPSFDLSRSLLALGLLMRPLHASGVQRVDKGLSLPLPADPLAQLFALNWWLSLVAPFLQRADFEVLLLVPQGQAAPSLRIGLSGGSAPALADHFGAVADDPPFVDLGFTDWIDEQVQRDRHVQGLASLLKQSGASLRTAQQALHETFLRS